MTLSLSSTVKRTKITWMNTCQSIQPCSRLPYFLLPRIQNLCLIFLAFKCRRILRDIPGSFPVTFTHLNLLSSYQCHLPTMALLIIILPLPKEKCTAKVSLLPWSTLSTWMQHVSIIQDTGWGEHIILCLWRLHSIQGFWLLQSCPLGQAHLTNLVQERILQSIMCLLRTPL